MPAFVVAMIGGLATAASSIVGRVLLALGFGYVTYSGLSTAVQFVRTYIQDSLSGLPAVTVQVLGLMQFDTVCSILLSAVTARMLLDGLQSDTIKRLVLR